MKRPLTVIANWKMHKTRHQAGQFIKTLETLIPCNHSDILIAAPFTALETCLNERSGLTVGAQNVSEHTQGAYTGEVSAGMLADLGVKFCLVGHSERRMHFHETQEQIGKKVKRCMEQGIHVVLCIGETFEEKKHGLTHKVLFHQITSALSGLEAQDLSNLSLAYEPVWAIGSGYAATAVDVQEVHASCRHFIKKNWGEKIGESLKILYGGSVNGHTLGPIICSYDVDGVLVGTASLDPTEFANIIKISRELKS